MANRKTFGSEHGTNEPSPISRACLAEFDLRNRYPPLAMLIFFWLRHQGRPSDIQIVSTTLAIHAISESSLQGGLEYLVEL